jgi:hypothetical protein
MPERLERIVARMADVESGWNWSLKCHHGPCVRPGRWPAPRTPALRLRRRGGRAESRHRGPLDCADARVRRRPLRNETAGAPRVIAVLMEAFNADEIGLEDMAASTSHGATTTPCSSHST